jgi:hypothetical protein
MFAPYFPAVETAMRQLYATLGERERRLCAAAEAIKLGRGGSTYIARLFDCDAKTIRRGKRELDQPATLPPGRSRKKGEAERPS